MEALLVIKTFLARLAGVPLATRRPPPRIVHRSQLYAPDAAAPSLRRPAAAATAAATAAAATGESRRTSKQRSGDEGEAYARRYLECLGLTFVAANVRYRDGEIDLVMRDRPKATLATPSLVFIEVRRRARGAHGGAAASVTREKRRRIVAAAAHYLVGLGLRTLPPSRFDVVTIDGEPPQDLRIEWIRDAFRDEG
jgi:putative endonuclease